MGHRIFISKMLGVTFAVRGARQHSTATQTHYICTCRHAFNQRVRASDKNRIYYGVLFKTSPALLAFLGGPPPGKHANTRAQSSSTHVRMHMVLYTHTHADDTSSPSHNDPCRIVAGAGGRGIVFLGGPTLQKPLQWLDVWCIELIFCCFAYAYHVHASSALYAASTHLSVPLHPDTTHVDAMQNDQEV